MFVGFIDDPQYILPIMDNFIIEGSNEGIRGTLKSWRFIHAAILAIIDQNGPKIL